MFLQCNTCHPIPHQQKSGQKHKDNNTYTLKDSAQEKYNLETFQVLDMNSESCSLATFFFFSLVPQSVRECMRVNNLAESLPMLPLPLLLLLMMVMVMVEHMVFVYCERLSNRVNRWFAMPKNSFQCQVIAMFKLVPYYRIYCNSNKLIRTHIHRQNQMSRISHTLLLHFISIPFNDGKYARITCILTSLPIDCICIGNIDPQTKIKPNACECVC